LGDRGLSRPGRRLVSPRTQPKLSPKEMAIITCITQGKRNKEIAFQLGTTEQVIKNYLRKIYDKLGVSDRLELALYCLHNKIIQLNAINDSKKYCSFQNCFFLTIQSRG
jgi:DNA-binding NarL/FixJ family response regulator